MATDTTGLPAGYLQTLDRGMQVLLAFSLEDRDLGVADVARRFGWDRAIAQRVLATLAHRNFLTVDEVTRRYRLGPALVGLGHLAQRSHVLTRMARPALARLMRACGESAVLSVPDGAAYRCDAAVDGRGSIKYTAIVGSSLPGHGGAAGHAIFAFQPADEIDAVFGPGPLELFTDTTPRTLADLHERYARVRADGYAVSEGEYDPDAAAVAAPIRVNGAVVGSLAAIGPRERVMAAVESVIAHVVAEAAAVSTTLSNEPSRPRAGEEDRSV